MTQESCAKIRVACTDSDKQFFVTTVMVNSDDWDNRRLAMWYKSIGGINASLRIGANTLFEFFGSNPECDTTALRTWLAEESPHSAYINIVAMDGFISSVTVEYDRYPDEPTPSSFPWFAPN